MRNDIPYSLRFRVHAQQLYVRSLNADAAARPLKGTEGAQTPAVSPDGKWVAFWANRVVKKVPLDGGGVATDLTTGSYPPTGLVWDGSGRLFYGRFLRQGEIWQIPVEGKPRPVTTVGEAEEMHSMPWPLPGGVLLYTVRKRGMSWGGDQIVAQVLDTNERRVLLEDAEDARYVTSGHLVFLRQGRLFAVPFDPIGLRISGDEVAVQGDVAQALSGVHSVDVTGMGQFAVSTAGTLAWVPGRVMPYPDTSLVTVDRAGRVTPLPRAPPRSYVALRVSPDGRRLAVTIQELDALGLWAYEFRRPVLTPLNLEGEVWAVVWAPDGQRLVFSLLKDGRRFVASQTADRQTTADVFLPGFFLPFSFPPDARLLAVQPPDGAVKVTADNRIESLIEVSNVTEAWPELSPDGRWLAYASNVSHRFEVYVRPYPGPGKTEQVSIDGGTAPVWNPRDDRELFFVGPEDAAGRSQMMSARFSPGPPARILALRPLFPFDPRELHMGGSGVRAHDVAPDGQRFYAVQSRTPPATPVVTQINIVQNWFEVLKAKVPARR